MIIDDFITPLGVVELQLTPADFASIESKILKKIQSPDYTIEVITIHDNWTTNSLFPIEETKGWLISITKRNNTWKNLEIFCKLKANNTTITSMSSSGEHLDAVWIENQTHFLCIGTEDGEMLKYRAEKNDDMPMRFAQQLGDLSEKYSFTEYLEKGFKTIIPELKENETISFQYLIAFNPRKKSKEYPDEDDISTWCAVNYPRRKLLEGIKRV